MNQPKLANKNQRNYCINLSQKKKKKKENFYENVETKDFADNIKFWKTVKAFLANTNFK